MPEPDPQGFVDRFTRVWSDPKPEEFAELWADGGKLLHPTMDESIDKSEIPSYVARLKALAPDINLAPKRWAARGNELFIEWTITVTPPDANEKLSWNGVDRFTLEGDRAIEGVAYFDTSPIWARMDPRLAREGDILEAAAQRAGQVQTPTEELARAGSRGR
jgi:hypothetical protein